MPLFEIDLDETFPPLSQAPITEAVLELRCRATVPWEADEISRELKTRLPEFPNAETLRSLVATVRFQADAESHSRGERPTWAGVRLRADDGTQIARFERDSFAFNQLAPYLGWDGFAQQSLRLWAIHEEIAKPSEIARIGLRFINRIPLEGKEVRLEDYLLAAPREPDGLVLPFAGFLHQDTMSVPGYDYLVQITKTIQPPAEDALPVFGLIIDVDVFSTKPWSGSAEELEKRLLEMRWLKNKAFFGSLTKQAKSLLT